MSRNAQTAVFRDKEKLLDFLIHKWIEISFEAVSDHGYFAAALSGGTTPIDFYHKLRNAKEELPWQRTHLFLVDERFVPRSHLESNYRMVKETLIAGLPMAAGQIHLIPTETPGPEVSARQYDREIRDFFCLPQHGMPRFDLILLGLGRDGHTASLFPGALRAASTESIVIPVILDETRHDRVTLSLPVLNKARHVLFLVTGEEKAPMVRKVIQSTDPELPGSMVDPEKGELLFVLDSDAASQLA
jgi:6-phosphogluconolactonase